MSQIKMKKPKLLRVREKIEQKCLNLEFDGQLIQYAEREQRLLNIMDSILFS